MKLFVSRRGLVARVFLSPGEYPGHGDILARLRSAGIRFGLDEEAVARLAVSEARPLALVVARGVPPQRGDTAKVCRTFQCEGDPRPWRAADFLPADWYAGRLEVVAPGTVLAWKEPATLGLTGVAIDGRPIPGRPGRDVPLLAGRNTRLQEDQMALIATAEGLPMRVGDRIEVQPVMLVSGSITRTTGAIDFDGDVVVDGSIQWNAAVHCRGDLVVRGSIQESVVAVGGRLLVRRGIERSQVQAARGIYARFAQHARIEAGEIVQLSGDALVCQIDTFGAVQVEGRVVGGTIRADGAITARSVGSHGGTQTHLALDPGHRRQVRLDELEAQIAHTKGLLAIVRRATSHQLEALPADIRREELEALETKQLRALREQLRILLLTRQSLRKYPNPGISAELGVYPGTILEVGHARHTTQSFIPSGRFLESHGRIVREMVA